MVKLEPVTTIYGADAYLIDEGDEFVAKVRQVEGRKIVELFSKAELAAAAEVERKNRKEPRSRCRSCHYVHQPGDPPVCPKCHDVYERMLSCPRCGGIDIAVTKQTWPGAKCQGCGFHEHIKQFGLSEEEYHEQYESA